MTERTGKILRTSTYVMAEKALKMGTYLIAGTLLARLVGTEIFGLYSTYLAASVIFTVISSLGLNTLLVKEFFSSDTPRRIMTNAFLLRLQAAAISGLVLMLVMILIIEASLPAGFLAFALVPIAAFQIADCFFESRQQMEVVLAYKAGGYIGGLIIKVAVAINAPDPVLLLAAHLAEMCIIFFGAAVSMFRAAGKPQRLDMDRAYQIRLFRRGMPLLFSSIAVVLYLKIDVFMVMRLSGVDDAGIYSAATRLCEGLFILSTPILISYFPRLLTFYVNDDRTYQTYMLRLFTLLVGLGIVVAFVTYVLSDAIIETLYGVDYAASAEVMRIYVLSIPLIFVGDLFSRWLVLSENLHLSLQRHIFGLVTNVVLNFLLIPSFGPVGAAVASVSGYTVAIIAFSVLHPKARQFYSFLCTHDKIT